MFSGTSFLLPDALDPTWPPSPDLCPLLLLPYAHSSYLKKKKKDSQFYHHHKKKKKKKDCVFRRVGERGLLSAESPSSGELGAGVGRAGILQVVCSAAS